ncbi:MAG TPA: HemK family protein methyltransferase [Candidatus Paceibacterota bacterium]|jgi:release factor glutamine methyltransferase
MPIPDLEDVRALRQDKYGGDPNADLTEDFARLAKDEPLAYVIGWIPFLGLRIHLDTRPLIPRPETEWWTEKLIAHLHKKFGDEPFTLLDLCAGSGAVGLSVLNSFPRAHVSFGELVLEHASLIRKSLEVNDLDPARADIRTGDLFAPFGANRFNIIATNPPYVPQARKLPRSVTDYEPAEALYAGEDGLELIRHIGQEAGARLFADGELWMECDVENISEAKRLIESAGAKAELCTDPYGRARLLVSYYS